MRLKVIRISVSNSIYSDGHKLTEELEDFFQGQLCSMPDRTLTGTKKTTIPSKRGGATRPGKRPMRILSTTEKLQAINRIYSGESKAAVARDIGVPESTLRGWYKSEDKLRAMVNASPVSGPNSEQSNSSGSQSTSPNRNMNGIASGSSSTIMEEEGPARKRPRLDQTVRTTTTTTTSSVNCPFSELPVDNNLQQAFQQVMHQSRIDPQNYEKVLQVINNINLDMSAHTFDNNYSDFVKHLSNVNKNARSSVTLCNNGLQYAKNNSLLGVCNAAGNSQNNQNISKMHNAAIATFLQLDAESKSCPRKYLKPTAEPLMNLTPVTPKRTTENLACNSNNSSSSSISNGSLNGSVVYPAASTSGTNNCVTPNNSGVYTTNNIALGQKLRKNAIVGTGISNTSTPIVSSPNTNVINNITTANLLASMSSMSELLFTWLNSQDIPLNLSNMQPLYEKYPWFWKFYGKTLFPYQYPGSPPQTIEQVGKNIEISYFKKLGLDTFLGQQQLQQQRLQPEVQTQRQQPTMTKSNPVNNNNNTTTNNNNSNTREPDEETCCNNVLRTKEDAIKCCDRLIEWLDQCEDPSVTTVPCTTPTLQLCVPRIRGSKIIPCVNMVTLTRGRLDLHRGISHALTESDKELFYE
ncbi:putative uncharacterized protein DDB_G0286901 [Polistes fuscatus]|uniref:putative uncharacterized protein DDB_G0286901 n=1 Tax=Polistes fuscatus TaxID=30207 RepID=UPI001CA929F7|nr:putative uncharacterized protein DDB_G0286901 [Polistes fuscatus]